MKREGAREGEKDRDKDRRERTLQRLDEAVRVLVVDQDHGRALRLQRFELVFAILRSNTSTEQPIRRMHGNSRHNISTERKDKGLMVRVLPCR